MDKRKIGNKPTAKWVAWFIGKGEMLINLHNMGKVGSGNTKKNLETRAGIQSAHRHYQVILGYVEKMFQTRTLDELRELFKQFLKEK